MAPDELAERALIEVSRLQRTVLTMRRAVGELDDWPTEWYDRPAPQPSCRESGTIVLL